ncbi:hypothetical protein E2C01_021935 [Portunus trituberculatus]|uniref:Uncharacterized protein n=1 Tax=Portunus trituberculatus TaxID=210409 RepID=A0A5B7E5X8_PORTR|nr:hypothetical protein [Portunus trituberculatus]
MLTGGSVVVGSGGGSVMYAAGGGVVYAAPQAHVTEGATPVLLNLPPGLQVTNDQSSAGAKVTRSSCVARTTTPRDATCDL